MLTEVILIGASPNPASKAVDNDLLKRQGHRTLYQEFPKTYLGRVEKGFYLLWLLPLGSKEAEKLNGGISVSSPFQDYDDFKKWGWSQSASRYPYTSNLFGSASISPFFEGKTDDVFKDPALPVDKRANIGYSSRNDMSFKKYRWLPKPSYGRYENVMNPPYGAIMFDSNWSPRYEVEQRQKGSIPDLNALSDVVFLQWLHACKLDKVDPKKLRVAYRFTIVTPSTIEIIEQALRQANDKLVPGWQNRKVFTMKETGGAAILGSQHGAAIAWLLIQHKEILGVKTVTEVAVWKREGNPHYSLRFTIKDV
ncbi:hypothetical protein LZ32DRAFT_525446 [Colletotrichum eremochloae]|nr:hypothetical protein LZ32DRAFT_525446 [Colletotrichum eremochloae]